MSETPEFSRPVDVREAGKPHRIAADDGERAALARRLAIRSIERFVATITLEPAGEAMLATGAIQADITQGCAVSGDDLVQSIEEDLALRFVPEDAMPAYDPDAEIELTAQELDDVPYAGTAIDIGEAAAQTLALAIDPYAVGDGAEAARQRHNLAAEGQEDGPLADLLRGISTAN